MSNELKIKLMMVAAVEANSAADAFDRMADQDTYYRDAAYKHRDRARKLLEHAAELADFTPNEMALLRTAKPLTGMVVGHVTHYTTILVVTQSTDPARREALEKVRYFPGSAYAFISPDADVSQFRGFTLTGVVLDNCDFDQLGADVQKSIRHGLLTVVTSLKLDDHRQLITRSDI